jgi:hypothetical protein
MAQPADSADDAPTGDPVTPDSEAAMAFATTQAAAQQRQQAQAAFDTSRMRRAFTSGVLAAKGGEGMGRAMRESSLGQNLEGAPPTQGS